MLSALLLGACSGSESYRGEWKAVASDGSKAEITFAKKSFTIKDEKGKETVYEYTQNQYKLESGRTSYGIDIKNASEARIVFPLRRRPTAPPWLRLTIQFSICLTATPTSLLINSGNFPNKAV